MKTLPPHIEKRVTAVVVFISLGSILLWLVIKAAGRLGHFPTEPLGGCLVLLGLGSYAIPKLTQIFIALRGDA